MEPISLRKRQYVDVKEEISNGRFIPDDNKVILFRMFGNLDGLFGVVKQIASSEYNIDDVFPDYKVLLEDIKKANELGYVSESDVTYIKETIELAKDDVKFLHLKASRKSRVEKLKEISDSYLKI
jgi:hypothetical protein